MTLQLFALRPKFENIMKKWSFFPHFLWIGTTPYDTIRVVYRLSIFRGWSLHPFELWTFWISDCGIQNSFVDCSHISYCIGRVAHLCHHFPVFWNILLRKNVYSLPKSFRYRIFTTLYFFLCRNPSYRGYHEGFMCVLHALGLNTGHKTYRQSFQLIFDGIGEPPRLL